MSRLWLAVVAACLAVPAGCSDSAKNADPKPVNVKEDPRIKRTVSGNENKASGQFSGAK
jgi:hypothetical protein